MQRFDLGRGESERIDERLRAQAVASEEDERHGAALAGVGEGARQLGDDEGVITLGRARQRDGAALLEAADGGSDGGHGVSSAPLGASRNPHRRANSGV